MIDLLEQLIACESVSPADAGCQIILKDILTQLGFRCQTIDAPPVSNLLATFGSGRPFVLFAGHTDVVSPGDLAQWASDPFQLTLKDGFLYGRGVADMKGSLVAMIEAAKQWVNNHQENSGTLGFLITSGEEGDDFLQGTPVVMQYLADHQQLPDYCIVGEPSSNQTLGDTLRVGRRGSLTGSCIFHGKQGHVAYPNLADNPIHRAMAFLQELSHKKWDAGNAFFPETTLQITSIAAGGQGSNIIPGQLNVQFNIRYNTEQSAEGLIDTIESMIKNHQLNVSLTWKKNGSPFLTKNGPLIQACIEAIQTETSLTPSLSTGGGTSDARFIAPYGTEVVELGPCNQTIHQVNECISQKELTQLAKIYLNIIQTLEALPK